MTLPRRSSVIRPSPARMRPTGSAAVTSTPSTWMRARRRLRVVAHSTSTSSVWPLPLTPATPTISPAGDADASTSSRRRTPSTSRVTSRTSSTGAASAPAHRRRRCFGRSISAPRRAGASPPRRRRRRAPTISSASWPVSSPPTGCVATIRPRRSTVTRSAMATTSRSLWEMNTTPMPSARSRRTVPNRASTSCGVSTAVGSSRISTRQSWCSALMISTRWRSPTDSCSTRASGSTRDADARRRLAARRPGRPADRRRRGRPTRASRSPSPSSGRRARTPGSPRRCRRPSPPSASVIRAATPPTRSSPLSGWLSP